MRHKKTAMAVTIVFVTLTSAFAHSDVANPVVAKRMMGMEAIGTASKTLGNMARGRMAFDQAKAQAAAREIANHAQDIPILFKAPEQDPQSEALPGIWTNFDDFTAKAGDLNKAAEMAAAVTDLNSLKSAMRGIGAACKACHKTYRE